MKTIIAATPIVPYITGDFAGHFVYASPETDQVLIWAPNMVQFT